MHTKNKTKPKVNVVTLGCSKNQVDSEVLMNQLQANDFEVEHESTEEDADIVIVNTCGFIDVAKEESINTILHYAGEKTDGSIDKLYVTGCLSQRYKENLEEEIPEVDAYFGTLDLPFLLEELGADYQHELIGERHLLTTPPHYAYLKISEGCNRTCAFCAIPLMRGRHVSKPIEKIVEEAKGLVKNGVKEVMLIAQELTFYGIDIYGKRRLPQLLHALNEVEGLEWIRLHYAYPHKFPLDIIDAIQACNKVCNYLDMPLQHVSDPVLKRMKRLITQQATCDLVEAIRAKSPDITFRTTLLVGFPGETEEDVEQLAHFIRKYRFNRLGIFQYSHEENTYAGDHYEDDIPAEVKQERMNYLMDIQREISNELNQENVGKTLKVLFDRKEGDYFVGRTEGDSPEVDNEVFVKAADNYVRIGDFAQVLIKEATAYDLYGDVK